MEKKKAQKLRLGWIVIGALAVFTGIEYWVAVTLRSNLLLLLSVIALIKAWLIVQYFMHVGQLWHGEEGEH